MRSLLAICLSGALMLTPAYAATGNVALAQLMKREDAQPPLKYARQSGYRVQRGFFRWPWERNYRRAKPKIVVKEVPVPFPVPYPRPRPQEPDKKQLIDRAQNQPDRLRLPPDCDEVNRAVDALPKEKLARALLQSSAAQRKVIAQCQEEREGGSNAPQRP